MIGMYIGNENGKIICIRMVINKILGNKEK